MAYLTKEQRDALQTELAAGRGRARRPDGDPEKGALVAAPLVVRAQGKARAIELEQHAGVGGARSRRTE